MPAGGPQAGATKMWVERLDPETLHVTASTPRLPGGRFWPGGIAAHANGDLLAVFGRWIHRLSPELEVLASHRLPVDRPYNSFVVLDGGELVTKDCDAPAGRQPSTVSVLDPVTLLPVAAPLQLPEPCVGRLSSDGERVFAIGATEMFALRLDRDGGELVVDRDWRPRYGPSPGRGFGWDPVVTPEHIFWMDNGRNSVDHTMLGSGTDSSAVRLWWSRLDEDSARSVEISGLPYGTESNPPGWDPEGRIVVAYDAGNAVVRAWRLAGDELEPLWRRDGLAHAGHLSVYPESRELVVGERSARAMRASRSLGGDSLVVLDLDSGEERARVEVPSAIQGFLFPAPGFGRDVYYQSLSTIARIRAA